MFSHKAIATVAVIAGFFSLAASVPTETANASASESVAVTLSIGENRA